MVRTLKTEVSKIKINSPQEIPWLVKLLENPLSPLALPGNTCLANHDLLHILLEQDLSLDGEAFVVGFSMGNDPTCKKIDILIYKFFSQYLYPRGYRFNKQHLIQFDWGYSYGRNLYKKVSKIKRVINTQPINQIDLALFEEYPLETIRGYLGIRKSDLDLVQKKAQRQIKILEFQKRFDSSKPLGRYLQLSGSIGAVVGGWLLASKISISGYGFIFLATSSFQLLLSSILEKNLSLAIYSSAVFCCVDLYGVYNWLLKP